MTDPDMGLGERYVTLYAERRALRANLRRAWWIVRIESLILGVVVARCFL